MMAALVADVPDAVQRKREARSGAPLIRDPGTVETTGIPGLQRTTALRFVLRCARDTGGVA